MYTDLRWNSARQILEKDAQMVVPLYMGIFQPELRSYFRGMGYDLKDKVVLPSIDSDWLAVRILGTHFSTSRSLHGHTDLYHANHPQHRLTGVLRLFYEALETNHASENKTTTAHTLQYVVENGPTSFYELAEALGNITRSQSLLLERFGLIAFDKETRKKKIGGKNIAHTVKPGSIKATAFGKDVFSTQSQELWKEFKDWPYRIPLWEAETGQVAPQRPMLLNEKNLV